MTQPEPAPVRHVTDGTLCIIRPCYSEHHAPKHRLDADHFEPLVRIGYVPRHRAEGAA